VVYKVLRESVCLNCSRPIKLIKAVQKGKTYSLREFVFWKHTTYLIRAPINLRCLKPKPKELIKNV